MAKTKAEEEAASAAKERAGREEESTLFKTEALDDERIASVRRNDGMKWPSMHGRDAEFIWKRTRRDGIPRFIRHREMV